MKLGFGKKGPSGVGCYGKLPLHGDYVSHQSDGPEARQLTAWLDAGYRLTGGQDDIDAAEIRFYLPSFGRRPIVGAFWPSADASGTRRFPFALFATISARSLSPLGYAIPASLDRTWEDLATAIPVVREAPGPDRVMSLLGEIVLVDPPEADPVHRQLRQDAGEPGDIDAAVEVFVDVVRLADAVAGPKRGEVRDFAVRIPLRTTYPAAVEASAWLGILSERLGAEALAARSHLFVRPAKGDAAGDLFVIHRELKPEDLGFLLAPTEAYPYGNLLGVEPDDEATDELWERLEKDPDVRPTLNDLTALATVSV